jgi:hypothetical protein
MKKLRGDNTKTPFRSHDQIRVVNAGTAGFWWWKDREGRWWAASGAREEMFLGALKMLP